MNQVDETFLEFNRWYEHLPRHSGDFPARGTIAAALVVLERLRADCDLRLKSHRAGGTGQMSGVSGRAVAVILERFGEERAFLKEGGRTNRGAASDIRAMLAALKRSKLEDCDEHQRLEILTSLQGFLVEKIRSFHARERLKFVYDPSRTAQQTVTDILDRARESGKEAAVAQYLVGAKLQVRFPDKIVENESYSTSDVQLKRPGDYVVENTAFHVTTAPGDAVLRKCLENVEQGLSAYLLVPDNHVSAARDRADQMAFGRITVLSLGAFVAQNIDELAEFSSSRRADEFLRLLETYNRRVNEAEFDKSLLLELPPNLRR